MLKREVNKMLKDPKYLETIRKYNKTVKECIDMIFIKYSIHYQLVSDIKLYYPINIKKKLEGVKKTFNLNTSNKSDINVLYIIDKICEVIEFCKVNGHVNNTLIILLHDYLSPKKLLRDIRINKIAFDYLINIILSKFDDVLVEGGEMVGPLASQSIGEKSTQLTLNSVEYNTELLLEIDGMMKRVKIGEWIDSRIKLADEDNIEKHPNDTTLEYVKDYKVRVMAPTKDGKIIWDNVTAVTKHPVKNKDGTDTLIKVTTRSGREVIATKGKSFLKRINNKIKPITGDKLKVGDYLPVSTVLLNTDKALNENRISQEQYEKIHQGDSSASYNFGGSLDEIENVKNKNKVFTPYIVLLEMMPFLPYSLIQKALDSKLVFKLVRMIPHNYIILARLMNTIKDPRDIQATPQYRKYIDGALRVISIKKHLRMLRSGKTDSNDDHSGLPTSVLVESDSYS